MRGSTTLSRCAQVSPERTAKFFNRLSDKSYSIRRSLLGSVQFDLHNLVRDAPKRPAGISTGWDVIFCRNVFIYFSDETIAQIGRSLAAALDEKGLLFLGGAETFRNHDVPLEPVFLGDSVAYKKHAPESVRRLAPRGQTAVDLGSVHVAAAARVPSGGAKATAPNTGKVTPPVRNVPFDPREARGAGGRPVASTPALATVSRAGSVHVKVATARATAMPASTTMVSARSATSSITGPQTRGLSPLELRQSDVLMQLQLGNTTGARNVAAREASGGQCIGALLLGHVELRAHNLDQALLAYVEAQRRSRTSDEAWYFQALVYHKQRKYREALAAVEEATSVNPYCWPAHHLAIGLCGRVGRFEAATDARMHTREALAQGNGALRFETIPELLHLFAPTLEQVEQTLAVMEM